MESWEQQVSGKVVNKILSNAIPRILLIHSGKAGRYWAYIEKIQYDLPSRHEIPVYYRDNAEIFKTWLRLRKLKKHPREFLEFVQLLLQTDRFQRCQKVV